MSTTVSATTIDRIVETAGRLWCHDQVFPTARAIAAVSNTAPSTVVAAFGTMDALVNAVVDREIDALANAALDARGPDGSSVLAEAVVSHALDLVAVDPVLARLPAMAVSRGLSSDHLPIPPALAVAVYGVGSLSWCRSLDRLEVVSRILDATDAVR